MALYIDGRIQQTIGPNYRTEAGLLEGEMKIQQLSRMQFCTYVAPHPKQLMIQDIDLG